MTSRAPWWKQSGANAVRAIASHIRSLEQWRAPSLCEIARLVWLYEREMHPERRGGGRATTDTPPDYYGTYYDEGTRESVNLLKSRIDTVGARLFAEIPAVVVSQTNATFEQEFRAAEQSSILNGTMNTASAAEQLRRPGYDGLLTGLGCTFPVVQDGIVRYERVLAKQLWWDPADAQYESPRSIHYRTRKSKSVVVAEIADDSTLSDANKSEMITKVNLLAPATVENDTSGLGELTPYERRLQSYTAGSTRYALDQVHVVYSWHLPGSSTAEDGKYLITVHGGTGGQGLGDGAGVIRYEGEWTRTSFPLVWWSPYLAYEGLEGIGLGHTYRPYQHQVDRLWSKMEKESATLGHTKLLVNQDGREQIQAIADPDIDVIQMNVSNVGGQPYEIVPANPQSPQDHAWFREVMQIADAMAGVNEVMAAGGTTRGATASGTAMYEEDERQGARYQDVESRWDGCLQRVGRQTLHALNDATAKDKAFKVKFFDQAIGSRETRWAAIQTADEDLATSMEQVGLIGRSKAGRLGRLEALKSMGAVSPEAANAEIAQSADVNRLTKYENAGRSLVKHQLVGLCGDGRTAEEYAEFMPSNETPFDVAERLGLQQLQLAIIRDAKEATKNRLRDYLAKTRALMKKQSDEMAAEMAALAPAGPLPPEPVVEPVADPGVIPLPGAMT